MEVCGSGDPLYKLESPPESGHVGQGPRADGWEGFTPTCHHCRYKKYVFLDPLAGAVTKTHVMLGSETEEKLFDAPLSISKREQLEQQVERRLGDG